MSYYDPQTKMTPEHKMAITSWETLRGPRPWQRSAYSYVFGAWIYCLKRRDHEAAEFLLRKLNEVRERYQ